MNGLRLTPQQVEWSVKVFKSHRRVSDFIFKEEKGTGVCLGVAPKPKPPGVAVVAVEVVVERVEEVVEPPAAAVNPDVGMMIAD